MSPPLPGERGGGQPFSPPRVSRPGSAPARVGGRRGRLPISRSQRWLFWIMLVLVVGMATYLARLRTRAGERFAAAAAPLPLSAAETHEQPLRLYLANDADGSLAEKPIRFPLPEDPNARARVVLEKLLEEYAAPGSPHPLTLVQQVGGVEEVYLLRVPGLRGTGLQGAALQVTGLQGTGAADRSPDSGPQLAVVNLTAAFAQNHPSGIEPETLTLLSMIATLRANLPQVAQVRFLVDGQPQATLAGHADLTHAYLAAGTQMAPLPDDPPRERAGGAAGSPGSQP